MTYWILLILLIVIVWYFSSNAIKVKWTKSSTPGDFFPPGGSCVWSSGTGTKEYLFTAGGLGQPDVMLGWSEEQAMIVIKEFPKLPGVITYSAVAADMNNNGLEDIVVGQTDGVHIWYNLGLPSMSFRKETIWTGNDMEVPMSLAVSDYDKSGLLSIFVGNYIRWKDLKVLKFSNLESQKNALLTQDRNGHFRDVAPELGIVGNRNTWAANFVDLSNDGWPDLVVANDEGQVEIYKNIEGRFEQVLFGSPQGAWMGIGIGDISGNGYQDVFFTNMGSTMAGMTMMNRAMSLFKLDIKGARGKTPPPDFTANHMLLVNKGDYEFEKTFPTNGPISWGAQIVDYDLDGHNDLLVAENMKMIPWMKYKISMGNGGVYKNKNGSLVSQNKFRNRNYGICPIQMDVNGNGMLDIVWINQHSAPVVYLSNQKPNKSYKLEKNAYNANRTIEYKGKKKQLILGGNIGCATSSIIQFPL